MDNNYIPGIQIKTRKRNKDPNSFTIQIQFSNY